MISEEIMAKFGEAENRIPQKRSLFGGSQRVSGCCKKTDVEERAYAVSGKPTMAPFPTSPETASPLSCLVKKLEQEPRSPCVQASGLFIMYS